MYRVPPAGLGGPPLVLRLSEASLVKRLTLDLIPKTQRCEKIALPNYSVDCSGATPREAGHEVTHEGEYRSVQSWFWLRRAR